MRGHMFRMPQSQRSGQDGKQLGRRRKDTLDLFRVLLSRVAAVGWDVLTWQCSVLLVGKHREGGFGRSEPAICPAW